MLIDDEELKLLLAHELDVVEFLDTLDMTFEELLDIVFIELDDEQKEKLERAIER